MKAWISNVIGIAAGVLLALLLFGALLFIAWAWITPSPYEQCLNGYVGVLTVEAAIEHCRHLPSGAFDQILW